MRHFYPVSLLLALCLGSAHAAPDHRLDGLKSLERNRCVRAGNTGPGAPKNLKLVPKYCECVANVYYDNLPKEEVNQLLNDGQSAAIDERKEVRLAQARTACKVNDAR
jgi:hypothetical protein